MDKREKEHLLYLLKELGMETVDDETLERCFLLADSELYIAKLHCAVTEYCIAQGKYQLASEGCKRYYKELKKLL